MPISLDRSPPVSLSFFLVLTGAEYWQLTPSLLPDTVVYTNGTLFIAFLSVARLVLSLLMEFGTTAYTVKWWSLAPSAFFSSYHAFVVWSFSTRLRQQCNGIFSGLPARAALTPSSFRAPHAPPLPPPISLEGY